MKSKYSRRIAAWAVFIIGLFLMLLGVGLLLRFVAGLSGFSVFLPLLFMVVGSVFAMLAIKLSKRPVYDFVVSFILLTGFFVFLSALGIIPRDVLIQSWPLVSVFSGFALIPAGWRRYGTFNSKFVVPSIVFIILGSALLVFSFGIVNFSFKQFMLDWWPLFIVLVGIGLLLVSHGTGKKSGDEGK